MNMQELQGGIAQIGQAQAGDLSSMQPQQVQQMANTVNPLNSLPQLFALAAVQKKQQDARRAQAEAAKRRMQKAPPTVAEKVQQGYPFETQAQQSPVPPPQQSPMAPPALQQPGMQGIPQLPTGNAVPPQYASGGIVAFSGGSPGDYIPGGVKPGLPGRIQYSPGTFLPPAYSGGGDDWLETVKKWGQRALVDQAPYYSNEGHGRALPPVEAERIAAAVDGASPDAPPPWVAQQSRAPVASPFVAGQGKGGGGGGIASLRRASGAERPGIPSWVDPTAGAPPARMTDEQFDAEMARQYERLSKLYGPDVAAEYIKEIKAERAGMSKKYTDNQNEAILRSGLAIMGGKSRHAAVNIGEGGIAGLNAYQAGRKDLDAQAAALRREEMQAAMQSQQRGDMIRGQSIGRADKRDTEMRQDRTEYMGNIKDWNSYRMDAAKLGIEDRKVDAMFANVEMEGRKVAALYGASRDDRIMKLITETQAKEISAVLKEAETNPRLRQRLASSDRALMEIVMPRVTAQVEQAKNLTHDVRDSGVQSGGTAGRFDASRYFSRAPQ
jgi:hypothetical protein